MRKRRASRRPVLPSKFKLPVPSLTVVSPNETIQDNSGEIVGAYYGRALAEFSGRLPPELRAVKIGGKWFTEEPNPGIARDLERMFTTGKIFP